MRILITGVAGFLGLNLLKQMVKAHPEAAIIGTDFVEWRQEDHIGFDLDGPRHSYKRLDVRDGNACNNLLEIARPTHIIHAAAVTLPDDSACSIQLTCSVNFDGTRNILHAATLAGSVQRVLLLSSSGLYDQSVDSSPCDESHPLDLFIGYARAKRQAENLMAEYEDRGGFPVLAARVGPVYGEFERARGSRPNVSMVQKLVDHLLLNQPIRVAGTDMYRDWTHASDIARALELLLFAPELNYRLYNVSSGISVTGRTILDLFIKRGLVVNRVDDAERADLVFTSKQNRKALVIERLKKDTGFAPRFDIETGITQLVIACEHHFKDHAAQETAR